MPILLEEQRNFPLPRMHRVMQVFPKPRLDNIEAHIEQAFGKKDISQRVKPRARVAVAVGSRGINNIAAIVKAVIRQIQNLEGEPFIVSAMGSHGGGTPDGQREVLHSYGITEESMGVRVVTSSDATYIGKTSRGIDVYCDTGALAADLVVPVNRVKLHTDFVADIQSGLCKMLAVGLGNHIGCTSMHEASFDIFGETLIEAAEMIIACANIGFGVAIVENACDETAIVEAIPAENIVKREKELLQIAKKYMPALMIPEIDILIVEEIGKNISGQGYDPNILGKSYLLHEFVLPVPKINRMVLLDVTDQSHGNAVGMGIFDVITRKLFNKLNLSQMYANAIAVKSTEGSRIPIIADTEEEAIRIAIQVVRGVERDKLKIVRIKNTSELERIEVSDALLNYVKAHKKLRLV